MRLELNWAWSEAWILPQPICPVLREHQRFEPKCLLFPGRGQNSIDSPTIGPDLGGFWTFLESRVASRKCQFHLLSIVAVSCFNQRVEDTRACLYLEQGRTTTLPALPNLRILRGSVASFMGGHKGQVHLLRLIVFIRKFEALPIEFSVKRLLDHRKDSTVYHETDLTRHKAFPMSALPRSRNLRPFPCP